MTLRVTKVLVSSTSWSSSFLNYINTLGMGNGGYSIPSGSNQLLYLPWYNINQIIIEFNERCNVGISDLNLNGINVPIYLFDTFSTGIGPDGNYQATWTFNTAFDRDKILLTLSNITDYYGNALDGEWTNGVSTFPSGDGTPGGGFSFQINIVPGSVNQDNGVNPQDVILVRNAQGTSVGDLGYSIYCDINGDGNVDNTDLTLTEGYQGTIAPTGTPNDNIISISATLAALPALGTLTAGEFNIEFDDSFERSITTVNATVLKPTSVTCIAAPALTANFTLIVVPSTQKSGYDPYSLGVTYAIYPINVYGKSDGPQFVEIKFQLEGDIYSRMFYVDKPGKVGIKFEYIGASELEMPIIRFEKKEELKTIATLVVMESING